MSDKTFVKTVRCQESSLRKHFLGGLVWTLSQYRGSWARPPWNIHRKVELQEHQKFQVQCRNIWVARIQEHQGGSRNISTLGSIPANRGTIGKTSESQVYIKAFSCLTLVSQRKLPLRLQLEHFKTFKRVPSEEENFENRPLPCKEGDTDNIVGHCVSCSVI